LIFLLLYASRVWLRPLGVETGADPFLSIEVPLELASAILNICAPTVAILADECAWSQFLICQAINNFYRHFFSQREAYTIAPEKTQFFDKTE
jgi:hypothetical protein